MMPKDAVLFTSRAPIGYVAIASQSVCTNQGFKSIVVNEKADPLFVYYLLKYNKDAIEAMGSGTTFKEVSGKTMRAVKVRIPLDVSYQKRIAAVLDSLDTKIENSERINLNSHRPNISPVISGYKQPSKSAQSIEITGFIEKSKPPKIIFLYTLLPLTA